MAAAARRDDFRFSVAESGEVQCYTLSGVPGLRGGRQGKERERSEQGNRDADEHERDKAGGELVVLVAAR